MAAFTRFPEQALVRYLRMFDLGELVQATPIATGIENSNYAVTLGAADGDSTGHRHFVLTITESLDFSQAPYFSQLLSHLDRQGLPVPAPFATLDGMTSTSFCGKPTWLFPRLPGYHIEAVTPVHCHAVGKALASLHNATESFSRSRANPYDLAWMETTFAAVGSRLEAADQVLLTTILTDYRQMLAADPLPARGTIHGDLFRDNVLFNDSVITGLIDFYHACEDFLLQDLAITLNDWCSTPSGHLDPSRRQALLAGYEEVRSLDETDWLWLPVLQRVGAMRFVLTRLLSGDGETLLKDPAEFLAIARQLPEKP